MDLRLRNLEQLDARAVPLPHGTEVVTQDRPARDIDALLPAGWVAGRDE
jgi:hypothetical protein